MLLVVIVVVAATTGAFVSGVVGDVVGVLVIAALVVGVDVIGVVVCFVHAGVDVGFAEVILVLGPLRLWLDHFRQWLQIYVVTRCENALFLHSSNRQCLKPVCL